jgi:hypothetical protein
VSIELLIAAEVEVELQGAYEEAVSRLWLPAPSSASGSSVKLQMKSDAGRRTVASG